MRSSKLALVGEDESDNRKVIVTDGNQYFRIFNRVWQVADIIQQSSGEKSNSVANELSEYPPEIVLAATLLLDRCGDAKSQMTQPRARIEINASFLIERIAKYPKLLKICIFAAVPATLINIIYMAGTFSDHAIIPNVSQVGMLAVAMFAIMTVHELAHAVAAVRFGCKCYNIGLGIFFIIPVFYADVSEVWRLRRSSRITVNLAGVIAQSLIGAALIIALPITESKLRGIISLIIAANTFSVAANLIPFAKLDGYWVLSDLLSISDLQRQTHRAMVLQSLEESSAFKRNIIRCNAVACLVFYALITFLILRTIHNVAMSVMAASSLASLGEMIAKSPMSWLVAAYGALLLCRISLGSLRKLNKQRWLDEKFLRRGA